MNGVVVVDASVAVKWVLPEDLSDRADRLYEDSLQMQRSMVGPLHLLGEATNAIHQRWRTTDPTKQISAPEADAAVTKLLQYPLQVVTPTGLYLEASRFARTHRLPTVYDSLYVLLAEMLGAELWTADQRLLKEVGAVAPWVRWLGDYPSR